MKVLNLTLSAFLIVYVSLRAKNVSASPAKNSLSLTRLIKGARITGKANDLLEQIKAEEDGGKLPLSYRERRQQLSPHIDFHPLVGIVHSKHPISEKAKTRMEALLAPTPSTFDFILKLPEAAVFTFYPGSSTYLGAHHADTKVTFQVLVSEEGSTQAPESIFKHSYSHQLISSGAADPATIDLSRFSGKRVLLSLRTAKDATTDVKKTVPGSYWSSWGSPTIYSQDSRGKTVVLILFDTLSAKRTGVTDAASTVTPALTKFAKRGVSFSRALTPSPWTLPSFTSLMTGLPPGRHRAGESYLRGPAGHRPIASDAVMVSEFLRKKGWITEGWVNNQYINFLYGAHRGFSRFTMYNRLGLRDEAGPAVAMVGKLLSRKSSADRFILLHLMDPHTPYYPPDEYVTRYVDTCRNMTDLTAKPCELKPYWQAIKPKFPPTMRQHVQQLHEAAIRYVDHEAGQLYDLLTGSEFNPKETLVIVTADHGEEFWEHGRFEHGQSQYNELLNVPLVLFGGSFTSPQVINTPVSIADVTPTILEFADIEPALPVPVAHSLSSPGRFRDDGSSFTENFVSSSHVRYGLERFAIQGDRYKYIHTTTRKLQQAYRALPLGTPFELFDLQMDPLEKINLFEDNHTLAVQMHERLEIQSIDSFTPGFFVIYSDPQSSSPEPGLVLSLENGETWNSLGPRSLTLPGSQGSAKTVVLQFQMGEDNQSVTLLPATSRTIMSIRKSDKGPKSGRVSYKALNPPKDLQVWVNCESTPEHSRDEGSVSLIATTDREDLLRCLSNVKDQSKTPILALLYFCEEKPCRQINSPRKKNTQDFDDAAIKEELQALGYIE